MGTTVLALRLSTPSVSNTIQCKHESESFLLLVRRQCCDAIQRVLRLSRCMKHYARRKCGFQPGECDRTINFPLMGMGLMAHQRNGLQPQLLLRFRQRLKPTDGIRKWQTTLSNAIEHLGI